MSTIVPKLRRAAVSVWSPLALACLFALAVLLVRSPGERNPDSDAQYHQVLTGGFEDWHPPAMARLWQVLHPIASGTAPIFTFETIVYWAIFGLVAAGCLMRRRIFAGWLVLALGLAPTLLLLAVNVLKDMVVLTAVLSAAMIFAARTRTGVANTITVAAALLLLCFGTLVRTNAVFAAGPLLLYAFRPSALRSPASVGLASVLLGLALVPVSTLVNRHVFEARDAGAIRSLQLFDLAGIASVSGDMSVLGETSEVQSDDLASCYTPILWDPLGWDHRCGWFVAKMKLAPRMHRLVDNPSDQKAMARLSSLWVRAIITHPVSYARHRLAHFNSTTAFLVPWRHAAAEVRLPPIKAGPSGKILDLLRYLPLFAPGVMLAMAVGVIAVTRASSINRNEQLAFSTSLAWAGLLYGLSLLVVGVATDPRYFILPTIAASIAAVLTADEIFRLRKPANRRLGLVMAALPAMALIITICARLLLPPPTSPVGAAMVSTAESPPVTARSSSTGEPRQ